MSSSPPGAPTTTVASLIATAVPKLSPSTPSMAVSLVVNAALPRSFRVSQTPQPVLGSLNT